MSTDPFVPFDDDVFGLPKTESELTEPSGSIESAESAPIAPPKPDQQLSYQSPLLTDQPTAPRLPGTFGDEDFAARADGYRIRVDRDLCIGAASCVALAPEIFQLDNDGIAIITDADGATVEALLEAAKSCPTNAIIIEDPAGNQIWP
ncbi:MAG: cytochrome P450, family 51 (sterol 14-demethylase) [Candidatus Berkelbacteria bacterium Gr01-1014_85]|uniref:Ferredoxin n=1 Tax=Candidatus Berkelbacteria bacterium Gr01-1014_85 TaxID=2017150 RepID=A0A554JB40_9BACT|nr:MAG: cytochrome P450, family 51 (sterol 14-demethylase) [Candidatus Berkelbacteria bacterium Gr01-1014_85]